MLDNVKLSTYFFPTNDSLSGKYLDAVERYLHLYAKLLGPYPFEKFAVVENFFPTGYGFPSWTLLGSTVVALPFILETSLGAGYGAPTEAARHARDMLERLEGLHLETTYTAKCVAGMIEALHQGGHGGGPVLFWNTYSSVDPGTHLGPLADYHALPRPFHRFFTGPVMAA